MKFMQRYTKSNLLESTELINFPVWNIKPVKVIPPSYYFSLPPLLNENKDIESLSSYINRLAEQHSVSATRLLLHSTPDKTKLPFTSLKQGIINSVVAKNMNGMSETAQNTVSLIENATSINDLQFLTLLQWKHLISPHLLLTKKRAWCPKCYDEQLKKYDFMYDKLLWAIRCVVICPAHQIYLANSCPYCNRSQKHISNNSRGGFCDHCKKGLADVKDYKNSIVKYNSEISAAKSLWIAKAVEDLLCQNIRINPTTHNRQNFVNNLQFYIRERTKNSINEFAHITKIWHLTIRGLLKKEIMLTMNTFTNICYGLDLPLESLLLGTSPVVSETKQDIAIEIPKIIRGTKNFTHRSRPIKEIQEGRKKIETFLKNLLTLDPPVSANKAARLLEWEWGKLSRNYPELYRRLVIRYQEYTNNKSLPSDEEVRKLLKAATLEIPPPSLQSVLRRFGCKNTGFRYQKRFPELCKDITTRFTVNRSKFFENTKEVDEIVEEALTQTPPYSAHKTAKKTRDSTNSL